MRPRSPTRRDTDSSGVRTPRKDFHLCRRQRVTRRHDSLGLTVSRRPRMGPAHALSPHFYFWPTRRIHLSPMNFRVSNETIKNPSKKEKRKNSPITTKVTVKRSKEPKLFYQSMSCRFTSYIFYTKNSNLVNGNCTQRINRISCKFRGYFKRGFHRENTSMKDLLL